ncbi:hypothetical protein QFZ31_005515 [Neobacillus niacini]|nr:hypothetical protein [Neobacillus niacini]MDQ0975637.1 hypothetical protein [Neobacillus niacini]
MFLKFVLFLGVNSAGKSGAAELRKQSGVNSADKSGAAELR